MINRRIFMKTAALMTLSMHLTSKGYAMTAPSKDWPKIIAHRGASGYLPEHSLSAYRRAAEMGADFIEPDLVFTKDGHLVVRHDRYLSTSTNIADHSEFADRKALKAGHDKADWFSEDFTLAELKSLRIRQAFPGRDQRFDDQYSIATFDEVLDLRRELSETLGRDIGIYPETKAPGYFKSIGLDYLEPLVKILEQHGLTRPNAPIIIQSFEADILQRLRNRINTRLMHLFDGDAQLDRATLENVATFADGIGPFKGLLLNEDGVSSGVLETAHDLGLFVHPWTFRDDQLPPSLDTPNSEFKLFFELGVDGVFTDFADTAYKAREEFFSSGE